MRYYFVSLFNKILKKFKIRKQEINQNLIKTQFQKDLKKMELTFQPVIHKIKNEENMIYSSQVIPHLPWLGLLSSGTYQIKFPSAIQSQINSGVFSVNGGVARNQSGHIAAHGIGVNPLIVATPIMLYQIGVVAFGAYHLKKINNSLEKINKKLNEIHNFQLDKRTAQINSQFQELLHISKGIIEFSDLGNIKEVLKRVDMIKHIRLMNLSNLLHLQKNLQEKKHKLTLKKVPSLTLNLSSKEKCNNVLDLIESYERNLIDYKHSLFLDIICTKLEVFFSTCKSNKETKSRLSFQKNQIDVFKKQLYPFNSVLKENISNLKKGIFEKEQTLKYRQDNIKKSWKKAQNIITDFDKVCINHIQSTEDIILPKERVVFLQTDPTVKKDTSNIHEYKQQKVA